MVEVLTKDTYFNTIIGRGLTCIMFQKLKEQKSSNVAGKVSNHPTKYRVRRRIY
jgi:hypothetical protein